VRGRGLMLGIVFYDAAQAAAITRECFNRHLILERCGNEDQVIKFFPPLTISAADLQKGLDIFADVVRQCLATRPIEISA
jgi:diaminobutyrate-2-oxoglutarate transaminase